MAENDKPGGPPAGTLRFNKFAVKLAGKRFFPPWALVHHTGRKSGKQYTTPVAPFTNRPDVIVIGLPWGERTDWVLNIVAAGGCTIDWKGRTVTVTDPAFVDERTALAAANRVQRFALSRKTPPAFLQLRRAPS